MNNVLMGPTLLIKVNNNVGDIVSMVADLRVPSGLNSDERGVVKFGYQSENFSFSRA